MSEVTHADIGSLKELLDARFDNVDLQIRHVRASTDKVEEAQNAYNILHNNLQRR